MLEDKLSSVTTFGLAPFFQKELMSRIQLVPEFALSFDEAHNETVHKMQLDLCIRYFDEETNTVRTEYASSIFLGHAKSEDILSAVKEATRGLDLNKLLHISMDGPNVNLAFHRNFINEYEDRYQKKLLQTGVCSLHVVSGALQHGHKEAEWDINGILRTMYRIFKDSPARRADYIETTCCNNFLLSFCATRWVENSKCAECALDVYENVKKYCQEIKPKPVIDSFVKVETAMKDDWTRAKLELFKTIASDFEPFLRRFQTEKSMFPFLFSSLWEYWRTV